MLENYNFVITEQIKAGGERGIGRKLMIHKQASTRMLISALYFVLEVKKEA